MTNDDFDLIERELALRLPRGFRSTMLEMKADLANWPPASNSDLHELLFLSAARVIEVNRELRAFDPPILRFPRELRGPWPSSLLICGREEDSWIVISTQTDATTDQTEVLRLAYGSLQSSHETLDRLRARFERYHESDWKEHRNPSRPPRPSRPFVTIPHETLLAEGRRLAKPAIALGEEGEKLAGVWQGAGVVAAPSGNWRHWLSIDAAFLPDNPRGLLGVLSVYEGDDDETFEKAYVAHDPSARLTQDLAGGVPVFSNPFLCLPDIEYLMERGSETINQWLVANQWPLGYGWNGNFPDRGSVNAYSRVYRETHPLYRPHEFCAMLGGLSPFDRQTDQPLLAMTLRDSEPWIVVHDSGTELEATCHGT